ncbi:MAG: phosphatidylserine synthase [Flavobacteriaceae bacterium]|jgi:CDP-diacylglycerol---serine O-phosphatidyltransferase|nr:phosphatidylserine synthase [Flavobacteriaceae bacterium]
MKKHIPNLFTSLNLLCGSLAILFVVSGDLVIASLLVIIGMFFDFFDGLAARLLHVQSEIGKQLDSLADMVSFGLVPGLVMFQLLNKAIAPQALETGFENIEIIKGLASGMSFIPFIGMLIIIASAFRLAKFNIDIRQSDSFIGLPTPANTLLIISLPLIFEFQYTAFIESVIFNQWFLIGVTIISSFLLNAELSLFALKFKTWDFSANKIRYVFLAISILAILLLKFIAIPFIILLYILMSLIWKE